MPVMAGGMVGVLAQLNGAAGEKWQENMNLMVDVPRANDRSNGNGNVEAGGFDVYMCL